VNNLDPTQTAALQRVLQNPALRIAAVLGLPVYTIEDGLDNLHQVIRSVSSQIGPKRYTFCLSNTPAARTVDQALVVKYIRRGRSSFVCNWDLHLIDTTTQSPTVSSVSENSENPGCVGILVEGTYLHYFLGGKCIHEMDIASPGRVRPPPSQWMRAMSDFDPIIADHKRQCLDGEKLVRYWQNKKSRILLVGPDGTEAIFQQNLHWWLNNFVEDRLAVYSNPTGAGQDKTDIIVVTVDAKYVIEIKWMGRNANKTEYQEIRINEGLVQVDIYLKNDSSLTKGYLVVYDGRCPLLHQVASRFNDALRHVRCDSPRVLLLHSASPSVVATTIAKGKK